MSSSCRVASRHDVQVRGELGIVEIDFFTVISNAAKHGFTREEIDRAYQAALASALDLPGRGRPKRSTGKKYDPEYYLRKMADLLISDPKKRVHTAAKEALSEDASPAQYKPSSRHLARAFRQDKRVMSFLEVARCVKQLLPYLIERAERDHDSEEARVLVSLHRMFLGGEREQKFAWN
jgi:hypothetical protein